MSSNKRKDYINAEELVPRKEGKKYDPDLVEYETLRFWPARGCMEFSQPAYTSKIKEKKSFYSFL